MPPRKKTPPVAQKAPVKHFAFNLTLSGVAGIALATFCLFLWMFFLGMWAGRTIISPCLSAPVEKQAYQKTELTGPDKTEITVQPPSQNFDSQNENTGSYSQNSRDKAEVSERLQTDSSAIYVQPRERKKRITSHEPSLYQGP